MAESPNPYLTRRVQDRKSELESELEQELGSGLANPSRPGPAGGLFIPTSAMAGNFFLHARLLTHALSSRMTILTQLVRFWEKRSSKIVRTYVRPSKKEHSSSLEVTKKMENGQNNSNTLNESTCTHRISRSLDDKNDYQ